jgi:hypothetical protein
MQAFAQRQKQKTPQPQTSPETAKPSTKAPAESFPTHLLPRVQRILGNQPVPRVLRTKASQSDTRSEGVPTFGPAPGNDLTRLSGPSKSPTVQTKLTVNTPGDIHEQEAEHVSRQVASMLEPQVQRFPGQARDQAAHAGTEPRSGRDSIAVQTSPAEHGRVESHRPAMPMIAPGQASRGPQERISRKPQAVTPKVSEKQETDPAQAPLRQVTELLSTSLTDWRVTASDARAALRILRNLRGEVLLHVVSAMRMSGRWKTLLRKLPDSDPDLIDLEMKVHPNYGYIVPGDNLKIEISSGSKSGPQYDLEVNVTGEGIRLPYLENPVKVSGMLPQDVPDFVAKAYIEDVSFLSPLIRLRVASRSSMYTPFHGPVSGEVWFSSHAIRDDSTEAKRRTKRSEFAHYVANVPTNDPSVVTALLHYFDWIDSNYQKPEFLSREPHDLLGWALRQSPRQVPSSPIAKFLELSHSIEALAQQAPPEEQAQLKEALNRYIAWLDAHVNDPKLSQIDPLEVWGKAYRKALDSWTREMEARFLKAAKERREKVDLAAVDHKLDEAIKFLQRHVWKLPEPEIAEDHTTGVGYLIMASDEERDIRGQIARAFLHDFVNQMLEPGFTSTSAKADFRLWLGKHPQLYDQFILAQSHPYVEHYSVEINRPAWQNAVEMGISFIPIVGQIVAAYEVISGEDLFGYDLGTVDRAVLGAFILLPMAVRVGKVTRGAISTFSIAKAYPTLTRQEVSAVFRASTGLRPGSASAKILGDAAAKLFAKKHITDPGEIKQLEKVLTEIGFTDPAAASSLRAERQAATELRTVEKETPHAAPVTPREDIPRFTDEPVSAVHPAEIGGPELPTHKSLRKELRQNLQKLIEEKRDLIDELNAEKGKVQRELGSINKDLKSIHEQLRGAGDRDALLTRRQELEARREVLKKYQAEELGSGQDLGQQLLKAKKLLGATEADYFVALTDAASKEEDYLAVKLIGKDEVFGTSDLALEVDHVYPRSKIFLTPGFEKLDWDQQKALFSYKPNLKLIPAEVNRVRGNVPYKVFGRKNLSTFAKNESAIQSLSDLETRMEAEINRMIADPRLIPMPRRKP